MIQTELNKIPEASNADNHGLEASFASLSLREGLFNNLSSLGYETMTPIQVQSLPIMLKGHDVIAKAKTGSGKTAAYGLSLLNHLNANFFGVQALVLCPTRELAEQVSQVLRRLARLMPNIKILNLSGGMPLKPQLDSLSHGAHIIVGTPGRVQKHLDKESLSLDKLKTLILDEADRMLDMGFVDALKGIVSVCPKRRQTLLFSATYPTEIKKLARQFMHNPTEVLIEAVHTEEVIEQHFYEVKNEANKFTLLKAILMHYKPASTLVFCNTKQQTTDLAAALADEGFSALALNGDMEQHERDLAVIRFANQSCSIMIATDVAARGLDIHGLPAVINFDLGFEQDIHTHRIGRTGRAGLKGLAFSFTTGADIERIAAIKENSAYPLVWGNIGELNKDDKTAFSPEMVTFSLGGGRKDKIRPGDILGALTKDAGLPASAIGKIDITALYAYVAVQRSHADKAFQYLQNGKLKGRKLSVRKLR
jgi:ATP-independent RNA helicase DbpA